MSFSNYSELKTHIQQWAHRDDIPHDEIIDLVESDMFMDIPRTAMSYGHQALRVRQMETRATATAVTTSRYLALPDGFLDMRRLRIADASGSDLLSASPESLVIEPGSGRPRYFTTTSQLEFDITPDSTYSLEMLYYKKPTALSSSNQTNAILTNYPNIYSYGCQWAIKIWSSEPELGQVWYAEYARAIRGANRASKRARYAAVPVMRPEGATP